VSTLDSVSSNSSEETPKPKILMSSTDITRVEAWEIAEKTKTSAFARLKFFRRPNSEELNCTRFVKYYEPYLQISGSYTLNFYRKSIHAIPVDAKVVEVEVLDGTVTPRPRKEGSPTKDLEIEARELVQFTNSATIIFDHHGKEVVEDLPKVKMIEVQESFYYEHRHEFLNVETLTERAVKVLKKRLVQRPQNVDRVNSEHFTVNEITIIYLPVYFAEYTWTATNEARLIRINGCTGSVEVLPITSS